MRIAVAIALLFGARFAVAALYDPLNDADLAWQRWLGERILTTHGLPSTLGPEAFAANGAAWVPQEWLLGLGVAASAHAHLFSLLALFVAALAVATMLLVALRARRAGASSLAIGLTTLCVGFAMTQSFGVRAQAGGWFFFALFMLLLECETGWTYAAIAVVALWSNVHASVLLAPVVAAGWALGALLDGRSRAALRCGIVAFGSALATCASPLGWHLPAYALSLMASPIRSAIAEWQPTTLHVFAFAAGVLPLAVIAFGFGLRSRMRLSWQHVIALFGGSLLALSAVRELPIAAILIAPVAACALTPLLHDGLRAAQLLRERSVGILMLVAVGAGTLGVAARFARVGDVASLSLPSHAIARAAKLPGTRRLYCEDFAWCSLALEKENLRTFIDGRCDPFPLRLWDAYLTIEHTRSGWRNQLARFGIDTVLAARDLPLANALASDGNWHVVWRDDRYVLFALAS